MPGSVFLTSSPCLYPPPPGTPAPFLMREDNGFLEKLKGAVPPGAFMLMIAAAPDAYAFNSRMREDFEAGMRASGLKGLTADILDARNAGSLPDLLARASLIMLCGGHVPTQNRFFRSLGLKEALRTWEGTVIGISAGSMNAASVVYAQPEEPGEALDPGYRRFLPGLGLTQVHLLPHLNENREDRVDGLRLYEDIALPDSLSMDFLAVPDGSYVLEDGRSVLYGEGWLIRAGAMTRVCGYGSSLPLFHHPSRRSFHETAFRPSRPLPGFPCPGPRRAGGG